MIRGLKKREYLNIYIYKSETLRNKNSFSKLSNQRDLREEPSAKQFAIHIHKPDECGDVSVIPFEKVEIISKGGFFSTCSGQEILLIQHRVEEKRKTAALMDIHRYR